jgi:hypothetical protein
MLTSFGALKERVEHGQLRNLERRALEKELQERAECPEIKRNVHWIKGERTCAVLLRQ